jgi:hypothetical protein
MECKDPFSQYLPATYQPSTHELFQRVRGRTDSRMMFKQSVDLTKPMYLTILSCY